MSRRRRRGFTLIEMLIVVAIISMLAGLLMPVFLRARESARRTRCLANMRNVAAATSLYLADWGRYWPSEKHRDVVAYFNGTPGHGTPAGGASECSHITHANPYLREAVLLDPYTGNREVWHCQSARRESLATWIVPMGRGGDWLAWYREHAGEWGKGTGHGPCKFAFPPGWGGGVTDSLALVGAIDRTGAHVQGIGMNGQLRDLGVDAIADASRHVVCGDDGRQSEFWEMTAVAYPDDCKLGACGLWSGAQGCCREDGLDIGFYERFLNDPHFRKGYTRHGGGSNVGFADGHARWFPAEAIVAGTPPLGREFEGIDVAWPTVIAGASGGTQ